MISRLLLMWPHSESAAVAGCLLLRVQLAQDCLVCLHAPAGPQATSSPGSPVALQGGARRRRAPRRRPGPRQDTGQAHWRGRGRCRRCRRLHRPQRPPERGALRPHAPHMCMHLTTSSPSVTVTTVTGRTLRQPCTYTSTNVCDPTCCIPQAIRPLRGRREAAAEEGCRDGHRGRSSRGRCRQLHGCAGLCICQQLRRRCPMCISGAVAAAAALSATCSAIADCAIVQPLRILPRVRIPGFACRAHERASVIHSTVVVTGSEFSVIDHRACRARKLVRNVATQVKRWPALESAHGTRAFFPLLLSARHPASWSGGG